MKEYKNIDNLFKDELSGFTVEPDEKVWKDFEAAAFNKKKGYYREIIAIAALLLISSGIFVYFNFFTDNSNLEYDSNIKIAETPTDNKTTIENESAEIEIITNQIKKSKDNSPIKNNISNPVENSSTKSVQSTPLPPAIVSEVKVVENISNTSSSINYGFISLSRLNSKFDNQISQSESQSIDDRTQIEIEEYIAKKRKFHMYTGASLSAGIMYYTDTPDKFTWSSDLVFGYTIKDFYIESGIGYQQVKQHGDYRIEYESNDSVGYYNQVLSFEINPTSPDEILYNTKSKTVFDSVQHYLHQSPLYGYSYINIPIIIGYKFYKQDNFMLSCETGLVYSFLNKTDEPIVSFNQPETQLIDIINFTPVRRKDNFKVHIALRASYTIHRSISISLQPEFSSYLNSVYSNSSGKNLKPYTVGIRAGVLFNF